MASSSREESAVWLVSLCWRDRGRKRRRYKLPPPANGCFSRGKAKRRRHSAKVAFRGNMWEDGKLKNRQTLTHAAPRRRVSSATLSFSELRHRLLGGGPNFASNS